MQRAQRARDRASASAATWSGCWSWTTLLLLLLGQATTTIAALDNLTATEGGGEVVLDQPVLDTVLDGVLQGVLAGLVRPQQLREHVRTAMQAEALLADVQQSAAACDLSLARMASFELWALRMVDASSKLVTGVLNGNLMDLGNFDECVAAGPSDGSFGGRYALPSLVIQTASNASASVFGSVFRPISGSVSRSAPGQRAEGASYSTLVSLRFALCVPSTCRASLVEAALNASLAVVNPTLSRWGVRLQARLPDGYTYVAGAWRQPYLGDWLVMIRQYGSEAKNLEGQVGHSWATAGILCIILVALVVIGTTLDLATKRGGPRKGGLLLSFSAWTNGRHLLAISPPSDTNFTCINGLRFCSAVWVVLGHRYRYLAHVPVTNLITIPGRAADISTMIIVNAPLSVDTFFLIGGMVNCYSFMRSTKGRRSFNFFSYWLHRYVRLTPAFGLMMAITATWLSLLGTGPMWFDLAGEASDNCQRNWWTGLLYVGNYVNTNNQCMMQSWYLSVDMQLHWLSPLLLYPLWKSRRAGLAWILVFILGSCAVPFAVTYIERFRSPVSTDLRKESQDYFMKYMYFPTHVRATSYVCGIVAGYILFEIKSGKYKRSISHTQLVLGWLVSAALCLTVLFGAQPLFDVADFEYDVLASSFYMGFHRLAWCVGMAWVVLACICGHGGPVNAILSWSPLTVLGRLSYGIYLTHAAIHIIDFGTIRTSFYYSDFKMVENALSDTVIATFLALCLCLTTESPIIAIEKSLRSRPKAASGKPAPAGKDNPGFVGDRVQSPEPHTVSLSLKEAEESSSNPKHPDDGEV